MSRLKKHVISFKYAYAGVKYTLKTQPNFQIHLTAGLLAIVAGIIFRLSTPEWSVVLFVIGLVLIAEMINTSIESVVDLLTDQYHIDAKIAKDVSAGMVLVAAFMSACTAALIFIPHLLNDIR